MYSIISFIHLLLVLSHNRIMPEMKAVWQAIMLENISVVEENSAIQKPLASLKLLQKTVVYSDNRTRISPANHSLTIIRYPVILKLVNGVGRTAGSVKRYLVFCQMKLEG